MYAFDRPSARIMAAIGVVVFGLTQVACGPGGDSDVVRSASQEGSADEGARQPGGPDGGSATDPASPRRTTSGGRVVFLGTSLTAGLGLDDLTNRFTDHIQAMADSAQLPFRIINAGASGDTSAGGLRRISWLLRAPVRVLVLELGANDGLRGLSPDSMEANLQAIVDSTRLHYPEARLLVAGMQAPPNLGQDYTSAFSSAFSELADANGGALIPFLLEGVAGVRGLNQADGIHPTEEGHRMVAETIWLHLRPILVELNTEQPTGL
jgi:acyl-CoA thioesterase-1